MFKSHGITEFKILFRNGEAHFYAIFRNRNGKIGSTSHVGKSTNGHIDYNFEWKYLE